MYAETKSHGWHAAPTLSLSKWLTCYALKSICQVPDFSWLTFLSCSAHVHSGLTVKISHALSCSRTKDHSFPSVHNKPPTLVLNMLHPHALKFKPVTQHSQPFHTNTAAAVEAIPAGELLRHETGFGDVQCLRQSYSIWNRTNTGFSFNAIGRNTIMQRGRGLWNCLSENIS